MSVDEVYNIIQFIINKEQSGYVSPDEFNLIINQSQDSFQDYLLGEFQQYQTGRAVSRVTFGQNQRVRQRLSPTIYNYNLSIDVAGFSPYPADYLETDTMWTIYGHNRIRYVQQDSLFSFLDSVIDPVTSNPIYLIERTGFSFYPSTLGAANLNYVRKPPRIIWGFTLDVNNRPIYDPFNSQDPVWSDLDMLEIIARALRMVGVNLQDNQISQYANEIKQSGQ